MAIHTHITSDGRKVRYNDETNVARAYVRRGNEWARVSMKQPIYQIMLLELKEKMNQQKPKLEGLVRNINGGCPDGLGKEE